MIVLDLMLPWLDGWSSSNYQAITGGSPIPNVVVSAARDPELLAVSSGIITWLPKPFDIEQLAAAVTNLGKQADARLGHPAEITV